jgi:hypothetical protein
MPRSYDGDMKIQLSVGPLYVLFVAIACAGLIWPASSFALEERFKPDLARGGGNNAKTILQLPSRKAKNLTIIRDAGIGLGVGFLAGCSFIGLSQGRLPNGNSNFDNEALTTGLITGLVGGLVTGFWELKKKNQEAEVSASTK